MHTTTDFRPSIRLGITAAVLGLAAGCASYTPSGVQNGQSADDVVRHMGTPTGRYTLPGGGQRFEYARGPMGKHTYMIDLDAGGRVTGWTQVLDETNFNKLPTGLTSDEVLTRLGRPSERFSVGWGERIDVWAYRYPINECRWFMVSMGRDQRVVDTSYGIDRRCDPGGNERE
jgi:hypothetical protein